MEISSTAFSHEDLIPAKYTCDSSDISPELTWSGVPGGAGSLALICDDPDAPGKTWIHWVIFNIPPSENGLPENVPADATLPGGARQGKNDFGKIGYGGPCPPGGTHRYYFKLYALDRVLDLDPGATRADLEKAMGGHVIEECLLMGKYSRSR